MFECLGADTALVSARTAFAEEPTCVGSAHANPPTASTTSSTGVKKCNVSHSMNTSMVRYPRGDSENGEDSEDSVEHSKPSVENKTNLRVQHDDVPGLRSRARGPQVPAGRLWHTSPRSAVDDDMRPCLWCLAISSILLFFVFAVFLSMAIYHRDDVVSAKSSPRCHCRLTFAHR